MPLFPTVQAGAQWCAQHFPQLPQQVKGTHMNLLSNITGWWWVVVAIVAYMVGRIGLTTFWSDLSSVYSWIRSKFSSTPATPTPAVSA